MGDSRFYLKGKFSIYGDEFPFDMSLNWSANNGECDQRISDFFAACKDKAYEKFLDEVMAREVMQREAETEKQERATLARLAAKYGARS